MKPWYTLRASRKTATLLIYGDIGGENTAKDLIERLTALGPLTELTIGINSPGGDVFEALAIYHHLTRLSMPVIARIDGLCASAATIIALAADEVHMAENARWMIHDPATIAAGTADALQRHADQLDSIGDQMALIYARKTGLSPEDIRALMRAETWYTAEQALAIGFVDSIEAPFQIAALAAITHPLPVFRHPPSKEHFPVNSNPDLTPDVVPPVTATQEPETPPPAAPESTDPVLIATAALDAHEPGLIPILLKTAHTPAQMAARLAQAREIRQICALVKMPELADNLISTGATPDQAKLITWNALAARDAETPVDPTPPITRRMALTRAQFDALSPADRRAHLSAGGRITD